MAWWDELGSTLPPQEQTPSRSGHGTWTSWLQDPVNQAGLMSFGLQMMTGGGHGGQSFGQQLATGLSHGFAGAAATDEAIRKQQELDEEQARKSQEHAETLANQRAVAQIGASSREELGRARIEGMLEAAKIRGEYGVQAAQQRGGRGSSGLTDYQAWQLAIKEDKESHKTNVFEDMTPERWSAIERRKDEIKNGPAAGGGGAAAPAAAPPGPGAAAAPPISRDERINREAAQKFTPEAKLRYVQEYNPVLYNRLSDKGLRDQLRGKPEYRELIELYEQQGSR